VFNITATQQPMRVSAMSNMLRVMQSQCAAPEGPPPGIDGDTRVFHTFRARFLDCAHNSCKGACCILATIMSKHRAGCTLQVQQHRSFKGSDAKICDKQHQRSPSRPYACDWPKCCLLQWPKMAERRQIVWRPACPRAKARQLPTAATGGSHVCLAHIVSES
jgi:hypothetical protein